MNSNQGIQLLSTAFSFPSGAGQSGPTTTTVAVVAGGRQGGVVGIEWG